MKKNFTFLLVALFAASVWAQTPDKVLQSGKYQRADVSAQISGHRAVGKASAVALKKRSERLLLDASSALPLAQQAGALAPQTASDDCPKITVSPGHPYREGFEDVGMFQLPECWSASLGTSFSGIFIYPKQFWSEIFIGVGQIEEGVQAAWISPANIGDITYMETPVFDITALSVPVLSFKYVLFNSNGKAEEFRVYYRGSQSDAWTPLPGMEFTAGNSTLNEWSNPSVALPAPSANYQLKFEITGQNAFGVGFDAVYIGDPDADCPTVAVTPTEPYREGFEYSKKIPECWTATTPANFQTKIIDGTDWAEFEVAPPIQEGEHTLWFSWGDAGAIGHIETPVFDITELNAPTLLFKYMLMEWEGRAEELRVYYRTSPSDAWALLPGMEFTADNSGLDLWFNASVALPATSATCQLKFEVTGMDAEGIAIDDIYIGEAVPCITPSALAVSNIGSDNADISWTSDAGMWNVIVSPVQITDFTSVTPTAQGLTAAWYHATELDAVKTYYVYVQSDCGADGKSDWALVTFRTAACNPEERCTYKVVTHDAFVDGWSGGTLSFVQNGDVVASVSNIVALNPQIFNIQLCDGIPVELVWDYGSWFEEVSFELLDISGNEIYAVAQGTLGNGNVLALSNPLYTFTPDCAGSACVATVVTPENPYHEGFESSTQIPGCWTGHLGSSFPGILVVDNSRLTGYAEPIEEGVRSLYISYSADIGDIAYIETPVFDITALSAPGLSFKRQLMEWEGRNEELRVYYRASVADSWTLLPDMEFTSTNTALNLWFNTSVALPSPSATYQLKFEVTANGGLGVLIDDVNIGELITCVAPSALIVSNIGSETADISWTSDATTWNVIVSPVQITDFTTVTPTAQGLTTPSYHATELEETTTYYVYVQSNCGEDDKSAWASKTFETTICQPEDRCTYTVVTTDGRGDGWDGAGTLQFIQKGIVIAAVRNDRSTLYDPQIFQVSLCKGIPAELVWHQGSYFGEVAFDLLDANGEQLFAVAEGELGNVDVLFLTNPLYTFTPCPVDLEVVASSIEDGAVAVDPETTAITITLNDDADVNGTPDFSGVTLTANGNAVDVVVTYEDGVITVTLADGAKLEGETTYTLTIPDGAVPGLDGATVITFTTDNVDGFNNVETDGIRIYPAITEGKVTIEAPDGSKVKVTDITGRTVDYYDSIKYGQTINISRVAGTYFVIVENGSTRKVQKIILK